MSPAIRSDLGIAKGVWQVLQVYLCLMGSEFALSRLDYWESGILQAGFSTEPPSQEKLQQGTYRERVFSVDAPALLFWVEIFGARQGDRETLTLSAPDGTLISENRGEITGNKARWMSYAGRKRRAPGWLPGTYHGRYRLQRQGEGRWFDAMLLEFTMQVR